MSNSFGPPRGTVSTTTRWIVIGVVISIIIAAGTFAYSWVVKPMQMASPDNIERLSREANNAWQALEAQLANIEKSEDAAADLLTAYGEDQSVWPQGKRDVWLQLQKDITNKSAAYNVSCAAYNAFWQDEWRALPAPKDIPTRCEMH